MWPRRFPSSKYWPFVQERVDKSALIVCLPAMRGLTNAGARELASLFVFPAHEHCPRTLSISFPGPFPPWGPDDGFGFKPARLLREKKHASDASFCLALKPESHNLVCLNWSGRLQMKFTSFLLACLSSFHLVTGVQTFSNEREASMEDVIEISKSAETLGFA